MAVAMEWSISKVSDLPSNNTIPLEERLLVSEWFAFTSTRGVPTNDSDSLELMGKWTDIG
jgi:hypothetical protein